MAQVGGVDSESLGSLIDHLEEERVAIAVGHVISTRMSWNFQLAIMTRGQIYPTADTFPGDRLSTDFHQLPDTTSIDINRYILQ